MLLRTPARVLESHTPREYDTKNDLSHTQSLDEETKHPLNAESGVLGRLDDGNLNFILAYNMMRSSCLQTYKKTVTIETLR